MAKDELVGNMPSEKMLEYLIEQKKVSNINVKALKDAVAQASPNF